MSEMLKANKLIETLVIDKMSINESGGVIISEGLKENRSITNLGMS